MSNAANAESDLRRSLDVLAAAVEERARTLAEADALVAAARDLATEQMVSYGAALDDATQAADLTLVRTMYWEHPQLTASSIADMLHLRHAGEVFLAVGAHTTERPCTGACGSIVVRSFANRTASRGSSNEPWCEACAEARDEDLARDAAVIARRRMDGWEWAGELDRAKELAAAGAAPARVFVEYPGVSGTYLVDGAGLGDAVVVSGR